MIIIEHITLKLQHFCSSLAKRVPRCSEVDQNLVRACPLHARCHSATPMAPHLAQSQRSQLHDMIRSASLSDRDIANVVSCSTRTVRSARASYRNFGNVIAPNKVRGRRSSVPSHVLTALLDLLTKPDLYLDEISRGFVAATIVMLYLSCARLCQPQPSVEGIHCQHGMSIMSSSQASLTTPPHR